MKLIIFVILSISCHLLGLLYEPTTPLLLQFSQAQPAQQIAINIVSSKPQQALAHVASPQKPVTSNVQAASTQFSGKQKRVSAQSSTQPLAKQVPLTKPKPVLKKPELDQPEVSSEVQVETQQSLEKQQTQQAAPASSAPVIAKQHSLKNQIVAVSTLPLFKAPRPPLNYPLRAKRRGYQGITILQIELAEDGKITNLSILKSSGFAELDKAALSNVSQWQFHPVMRENQNVKARFSVPIEFSLRS